MHKCILHTYLNRVLMTKRAYYYASLNSNSQWWRKPCSAYLDYSDCSPFLEIAASKLDMVRVLFVSLIFYWLKNEFSFDIWQLWNMYMYTSISTYVSKAVVCIIDNYVKCILYMIQNAAEEMNREHKNCPTFDQNGHTS